MRHRKRYIAFRIIGLRTSDRTSDQSENIKKVAHKLMENLISLFGEVGLTNSSVWIEYMENEYGIIRCSNESLDKVMIAFSLISEIDGVKVLPITLGVSGTIKRCKMKYLKGGVESANATDGL